MCTPFARHRPYVMTNGTVICELDMEWWPCAVEQGRRPDALPSPQPEGRPAYPTADQQQIRGELA